MFNWKFIASAAVVIVAACVGIFFYARWDVQRFRESLGEPPIVPREKEVVTETVQEQTPSAVTFDTTSASENLEKPEENSGQQVLDTEPTDPETQDPETQELSEAELDALLEMFEQQALTGLREAVDVGDEVLDNTELVDAIEEAYGHSPEVDVLSEVMSSIDEGNTTLDNLIEMVEAYSAILPESMPEGTISLLEMLRRAKAGGGLIVADRSGSNITFITPTPGSPMIDGIGKGTIAVKAYDADGNEIDLNLEGATIIK